MTPFSPEHIAFGIASYVVLLFSISVHESAHGWMAYQMGDDTAASQGRISLNPIVHIDPVGTLLIPMLAFISGGLPLLAWAKPTPVGAHNFNRLARGHILVAGAGPTSNIILAVLFTAILIGFRLAGLAQTHGDLSFVLLVIGVQLNVGLAIFNLIPIPPLDGSWIASWGLPRHIAERYDRVMEPYGMWILLLFMIVNYRTGILGLVIQPVVDALLSLVDLLSR